MANDAEWIEDVKRWVLSGERGKAMLDGAEAADEIPLGYEAAEPFLLARRWPDAPTTDR